LCRTSQAGALVRICRRAGPGRFGVPGIVGGAWAASPLVIIRSPR